MNSLIDQLDQTERSLIFSALQFMGQAGSELSKLSTTGGNMEREFMLYTQSESEKLMHKLFADQFPDELSFIKCFNQHCLKNNIRDKSAA